MMHAQKPTAHRFTEEAHANTRAWLSTIPSKANLEAQYTSLKG